MPSKYEVKCRSRYVSGLATLTTTVLTAPGLGIYKQRRCELLVPGKILAETVAIYPSVGLSLPIFGSEWLEIGPKCFGAVDFHPSSRSGTDFSALSGLFAPRTLANSRHYDLDEWFGPYLWVERGDRGAFDREYGARERAYRGLLNQNLLIPTPGPGHFDDFNRYMALHDPARGILRSYFGAAFADDYLERVLFSPRFDCGVCIV